MKKFFINLIIIILFIGIFIFGLYFLNEYIIQNETVAEIFKQGYEDITLSKNNSEIDGENPINDIQTSSKNMEEIDGYYYNQLDEYAKIIYNKLNENKENMKSGNYTIEFGKTFNNLLNSQDGEKQLNVSYQSALDAYLLDNPDVFYLNVTKLYLLMNSRTVAKKTTYKVSIGGENGGSYYANGFYSQEQINSISNQMQTIADSVINTYQGNSQYNKCRNIHDWLVDNLEYEQTTSQNNIRNIYGAIIEKKVVCEGYAKAYKYLLDRANIPNIIVVGYGTSSSGQTEEHAWNYIKFGDEWYAADTTWDDPIIQGNGKLSASSKYKYFLKGSNTFNKDHKATGKTSDGGIIFSYPELNVSDFE